MSESACALHDSPALGIRGQQHRFPCKADVGLGSPRKLKLGRIVISAEGGAFDTPQGARPPPVYLGASGPSGGRSLVEVEQQLVEVAWAIFVTPSSGLLAQVNGSPE